KLRHRYRLLSLMPRSRAISAMDLSLLSMSRTVSRLNSSLYFLRSTTIDFFSSIQCTCLFLFPPLNRGKFRGAKRWGEGDREYRVPMAVWWGLVVVITVVGFGLRVRGL